MVVLDLVGVGGLVGGFGVRSCDCCSLELALALGRGGWDSKEKRLGA